MSLQCSTSNSFHFRDEDTGTTSLHTLPKVPNLAGGQSIGISKEVWASSTKEQILFFIVVNTHNKD